VIQSGDDGVDELVIGRSGEALLELRLALEIGGGSARVPVRLGAAGVAASGQIELERWHGDRAALATYFESLAQDWRGWNGSKDWSDAEGAFRMSASHDGLGTISLVVTMRSSVPWDLLGSWELRVVVPIESGSLEGTAAGVRRLLNLPVTTE
jgi:hypothetical protein